MSPSEKIRSIKQPSPMAKIDSKNVLKNKTVSTKKERVSHSKPSVINASPKILIK
jgi:hypothetical protein